MRHAIGPLLFLLIASRIDRGAVLQALSHADLRLVLAAGAIVLLAIPLRASRWNGLLAQMGHHVGILDSLRLYASATFAGTATPARVGEIYKAAPLVKRGVPARRALASVLVDRVFDVAVVALVALLYAAALARGPAALTVACAAAVLVLIASAGFLAGAEAELVARARRATVATSRWSGAAGVFHESLAAIAAPGSLLRATLLTAAASTCAWIANHCLVVSLGLPLDPFETAGISAAAGLAALAPVSMLGVGTRDAALLVLLVRYGVAPSDAVALSTLFLLLNLWTGLACGAAALLSRGRP